MAGKPNSREFSSQYVHTPPHLPGRGDAVSGQSHRQRPPSESGGSGADFHNGAVTPSSLMIKGDYDSTYGYGGGESNGHFENDLCVFCLAHSELSRRIFNAVCSMRVFLWITSICGNILIVAMVEREVEIRQALAIKHRSKDNLTRFSKYSVRRNAIFTKKTAFLRGFGNELCITSC